MAFKMKEFMKVKFEPRIKNVPVKSNGMAGFFADGEKKEFQVRSLTGEEMAVCNEAQTKNKNMNVLIAAIAGGLSLDKVKDVRLGLGLSEEINLTEDLARRIELLRIGCVDPELDTEASVKIFRVAAVDGYELSNQILQLSQQGMIPGGPKASGKKQTSEPLVISATPEENASTN